MSGLITWAGTEPILHSLSSSLVNGGILCNLGLAHFLLIGLASSWHLGPGESFAFLRPTYFVSPSREYSVLYISIVYARFASILSAGLAGTLDFWTQRLF